jgi:hypothetical protein
MTCKYKISKLILLACLILPVESCLEPISPALKNSDSAASLVVAGQITNEVGPFRVKLTTSVPINVMYYVVPVLDADVRIIDDKGNSFLLNGDDSGWYETEDKDLKGIPGNSYTLTITTKEGIQYESSPVLMQEVPDIDSLYFEEVENTKIAEGQVSLQNWLNILVNSHDPDGKTQYWSFEFEETWEVMMLTDHVKVFYSQEPPSFTFENVTIDDEKKICWVTKPSTSVLVTSTTNNSLDEIRKFNICSLGPGEDKLNIRYSILVKQSSISKELYTFWKQLMDANENLAGIYGKIPAQVYGNIKSCDGSSNALGYFSASAVKEKRLFIDRTQHNVETVSAYKGCSYFDYGLPSWIPKSYFGTIKGTDIKVYCSADYCADCRTYGTNVKPVFWK